MRTVFISAAVFTAHVVWELVRWDSWVAWQPALLMAFGVGGLVGILTHFIRRRWILALTLVGLALLAASSELAWAIRRVADLHVWAGHTSVWLTALTVAAVVGMLAFHGAGLRLERKWQWILGSALGFALLSLALPLLQRVAPELAWVLGWIACLGVLGWVIVGWHEQWLLPILSVAFIFVLARIPDQYPYFYQALLGLALVTHLLWMRRLQTRHGRPFRRERPWTVAGLVGLCIVALFSAERQIHQDPTVWRLHPNRLGLFSAMVRTGYRASDVDGDGIGALFGERDCAPFDGTVSPQEHEIPGNDVDENCVNGPSHDVTRKEVRALEDINPRPTPWKEQGDVVLVIIDTLREDAVHEPHLKNFRRLKEEAWWFSDAYAPASFTTFSMLGIFGSWFASGVPLTWHGRFSATPDKPEGLPVWLAERGYQTAFAGGRDEDRTPYFTKDTFGHGFDRLAPVPLGASADDVTAEAIRTWHAMSETRPRFLWVHYMQVHDVVASPEYGSKVAEVDATLGRLFDGIGSDALWLITADHGESLGEHGEKTHGQSLFQEVVRVPLFVRLPDRAPQVVRQQSSLRSIAPTVLALVAPDLLEQGNGPYLCLDQQPCHDLPAVMQLEIEHAHLHAVVHQDWKVIRDLTSGTLYGYDLRADPKEQQPIMQPRAEAVRTLIAYEEGLFGKAQEDLPWLSLARTNALSAPRGTRHND